MNALFFIVFKEVFAGLFFGAVKAVFTKYGWAESVERTAVRFILTGLRALAARTENTVDDDLIRYVIKKLQERGVKGGTDV